MDEKGFDIFKFLNISHREEIVHTPMLAFLLNAKESHGLESRFLGKFLELLSGNGFSVKYSDAFNYEWVIEQEHRLPGGRIDILLLCPAKKLAIAIENKIRAKESKTQLPAYHKWLCSLSPDFTTQRLVLLTLNGVRPKAIACETMSYHQILDILRGFTSESPETISLIRTYAKTLGQLLDSQHSFSETDGEVLKEVHNIFRLLRISRRETVLHSRMLAALLNPNSLHNQGTLFLYAFLKMAIGSSKPLASMNCEWNVKTEHKIEGGFLDIVLDCKQKGILIVIENKIDSGEGPKQIDRYGQWMRGQLQSYPNQTLLFLTPDGRKSVTAKTSQHNTLSYQQLIEIILSCEPKVKSQVFRSVLKQYLEILHGIAPQLGDSSWSGMRMT